MLLEGCAQYVALSGRQTLSEYEFEVTVPKGWHRAMHAVGQGAPGGAPETTEVPEGLVLTRDGLLLQQIRVVRVAADKELKLIYQAAARYYFDRDLPVFEQLRESFRLLTKPA